VIPTHARAVVVGGGVAGCSVAYHLARLGWKDVVVLEQHDLSDGTTWHSAGFVGQLRSTISQTRMIMYSASLYAELAASTGLDSGWHPVGGLRIAATAERVEELRRARSMALTYGLDLELLTPAEAATVLPLLDATAMRMAAWIPTDGYLDPELLVGTLAEAGRRLGVTFSTGVRVTRIDVAAGRVSAVHTTGGTIQTDVVVNAAGAAAGAIGRLAGAGIPIVPMRHQYALTEPVDGVGDDVPTVRDPDRIVYFRPKDGGLLVGGYARSPVTEDDDDPLRHPRTLYQEDRERFAESWDGAQRLLPSLRGSEPSRFVCGPEAFTPDGEFILGETEVRGLWVAAGFCVHGLAGAGGVGKVMAEWIADGEPEYDVSGMDIRRFGAHYGSRRYARVRALDAYSRYYDIVYPGEDRPAGRPLRVSPVYPRLQGLGARFAEKAGWERVDWFEANGSGEAHRPDGWAGRFWSPAIRAESLATRDAAGLFDQTSFGKLTLAGPDALATLERVCANRIDRPVGSVIYTQMLNERGGIEADVTVTRTGDASFRLVTGTASARRDREWIAHHTESGADVQITDISGTEACLCLWGPQAGAILGSLCDEDDVLDSIRFLQARRLTVAGVPLLAQRVTFVGEFGFELHCPAEYGLTLWDALWAAGRPLGLLPAGYRALDALRIEKGYRLWGSDITPETTPYEAGLGFAVALDKPGGFIGQAALVAEREAGGRPQRLRALILDDAGAVCLGSEPIRVGDEICGRVTTGGFGYRLDCNIAYGYLPRGVEPEARVEVSVFDEWKSATVAAEPLYDPEGLRVRGAAASPSATAPVS
jgi:glycine cleavage system aminomethyltransferase T/glycine/D-amino acid oxidase-like deaminating enzyme